jgi:hypothetical protein
MPPVEPGMRTPGSTPLGINGKSAETAARCVNAVAPQRERNVLGHDMTYIA